MKRFFVEAAYLGTRYAGWQRQPNDVTVQQVLEESFSLILREDIGITGCGRTDAGVHADQYYFHFDTGGEVTPELLRRFNRYLPADIALRAAYEVPSDASARFSAIRRGYRYHLSFAKDPFRTDTAVWYGLPDLPDQNKMQEVAQLLTQYGAFKTFCKEGSDATHYLCELFSAEWEFNKTEAIFRISANRFLRGMVRLIVGACIQAGRGKISIEQIREALDAQSPLDGAESAAPQGLFLESVIYPDGLLDRRIA